MEPSSYIAAHPRQIGPSFVLRAVASHDARLSKRMPHFRAFRATYRSRFWDERTNGGTTNRYMDRAEDGQIKVEVNRSYGWVESYVGSLFNSRVRVHLKDDPEGRGHPQRGETVVNNWLRRKRVAKRVTAAMRQALMYDGAGIKIGRDDGFPRDPLARVWIRTVPWWEMVLDYDVTDLDDQRFIGHVYWLPAVEARRRYGRSDLTGTIRPDALASRHDRAAAGRRGRAGVPGDVINDEFVRVLEWYNLVDDYCVGEADLDGRPLPPGGWTPTLDEQGRPVTSRGRYEVWLPDQRGATDGPVRVHPIPYDTLDGEPLAPLVPLVFVNDPEYPLHGLSALERVYDQIRELNISRTFKSNATKRNSRQIIAEKGTFTPESKVAYEQGRDGAMLEYEQNAERSRSPSTVTAPLLLGSIPADNYRYDEEIERDLAQGSLQAPFTRGDPVPNISATQTNYLNQHSQTEVGQLALSRDLWIEQFVEVFLRVLVRAIRADGPDARLRISVRRKSVTVTPEDLEGDFDIEVLPGPTTPIAQDRERQTFLAISPMLWKLVGEVRKGDPVAAMGLDDLVERFELDERWRAENILRLDEERAKRAPEPAVEVKALPGAGSAPPGAGSAPMPDDMGPPPEDDTGRPMPQPGPPAPGTGAAQPNDGGSGVLNVPAE